MTETVCSFEDCGRKVRAKSLCVGHYHQIRAGNDLSRLTSDVTPEQKFWGYVEKTDGCWNWSGPTNGRGYGTFTSQRVKRRAHRFSFEIHEGQIPDRFVVDHKCHNTLCVNPDHLHAVEQSVNTQNRAGASSNSKSGARGVRYDPRRKRWYAEVTLDYKKHFGGSFETQEEAELSAVELRRKLHTNSLMDKGAQRSE